MIKAISFDLDHTLYNRNATWDCLLDEFTRRFLVHAEVEWRGRNIAQIIKESDREATYDETSWRGMFVRLQENQVLNKEIPFSEFYQFIYTCFPKAIVPYSDTYETLSWCRKSGFHPSIITNGHTGLQEKKIACMGLEPYLEECIICNLDSGQNCKPKPDAFQELAKRLKLRPEEILYVGDNPVNDVQGAREAGMKTAWLNIMGNWDSRIEPADYEIGSLGELRAITAVQP